MQQWLQVNQAVVSPHAQTWLQANWAAVGSIAQHWFQANRAAAGSGLLPEHLKQADNLDDYTWDQAMASPHREKFLIAAQQEIDQLTEHGTWHEDLKKNATSRILPFTWVFKIKRDSDGKITKFKARLCARGDLEEGTGDDNYSPVAAWSTVRSFLTISHIRKWITTSIDFTGAFLHSPMPKGYDLWCHIPRGYKSTNGPTSCLKLDKSTYGIARAPKLWYLFCTSAFKKLGLKMSKHDECLWYGDNIIRNSD